MNKKDKKPPNLIWFLVDSVRNYRCDEDDRGKLGIMEKMAPECLEFTTVVSPAASSVMAVSAMMTGCPAYYISRDYENFFYDRSYFVSLNEILRSKGYKGYGIIFFREGREKFINLFPLVERRYWPHGLRHIDNWSNDQLNQILFNLLDEGLEEPFFLYVHYNCRLDPQTSPKVELAINRLKEKGYYGESIFVLCSDHGYPDPGRGMGPEWLKKRGLTHDLILTDDNILIPLYIRYPGVRPMKMEKTVSALDIMPTILDIMGIERKAEWKGIRGQSLLPLINNRSVPQFEARKIRIDNRFLMQPQRVTAIRGNHYKYCYHHDSGREEFYDILADRGEENNLVDQAEGNLLEMLNNFREEFKKQEEDSIRFHLEYMCQRLKDNAARSLKPSGNDEHQRILVLNSFKEGHIGLIPQVIARTFAGVGLDLLSQSKGEPGENQPGFQHIFHYTPEDLDLAIFNKKFPAIAEGKYDMVILLINKSESDVQYNKKITKLAHSLRSKKLILVDNNLNIREKGIRGILFAKLKKWCALSKFYLEEPSLFFKDIFHKIPRKIKALSKGKGWRT